MMTLPKCPVEIALLFLNDKYKILIIGYLLSEPLRPSQLRQKISNLSKNSLNKRLKELENLEVIERKIFVEIPPKVEYSLTDLGKSFYEILLYMEEWGKNYNASV